MSSLASLSKINNHGCELLQSGDISNATIYFRHTLAHVKKGLQHLDTREKTIYRTKNIVPMPSSFPISSASIKISRQSHWIHSQAIRMVSGFIFSNDPFENSKIYAAIAIFNLGLAAHLQGLMLPTRRKFEQAKILYQHAMHLMSETVVVCYEGRATGNDIFDLVILGLLNNMALLHLEFSEHAESMNVFRHLIRYAESFPRSESVKETVNYFLLNATIFGLNPPSGAAAA